jgi:hypothetical protein
VIYYRGKREPIYERGGGASRADHVHVYSPLTVATYLGW